MKAFRFAVLLAGLGLAWGASAGPLTDQLSACLADNTTGKDRKEFARWIFAAMSVHPELADLSAASPQAREDASRAMANVAMTLLTERCTALVRAAVMLEGAEALQTSFSTFGRLAMQEVMSDAKVTASVGEFQRFLDRGKIEAIFKPK
jgi:hypothetical protein